MIEVNFSLQIGKAQVGTGLPGDVGRAGQGETNQSMDDFTIRTAQLGGLAVLAENDF